MDRSESFVLDLLVHNASSYIGNGEKATYVSAPITTGLRYVEWYRSEGRKLNANTEEFKLQYFDNVIAKNNLSARIKIDILRNKISKPLIDPTKFEWPEWSQITYQTYWAKVIEEYVDE